MTTDVDPSLNGHAEDAQTRAVDALGNAFSPAGLEALEAGGIPVDKALEYGVRAVAHPDHVPDEIARWWVQGPGRGPGLLFEWRDQDRTVVQFRPDTPVVDDRGEAHKYVLPKGCGTFLNHLRAPAGGEDPYLFVEGTKQGIAAAVWAPVAWGVVAVPGCDSWVGTDLSWAAGREVVVVFDGDVATNRNVHDAAVRLQEALELEGAEGVRFAKIAGARSTDGLDDVLGRRAAGGRTSFLEQLAKLAVAKLGRPPGRKAASPYMTEKGLLARTTALAVLEGQPAALGKGSMIALYRDGAFRVDRGREPLIDRISDMLGEDFRPAHRSTVEEYLVGELTRRGLRLGDRATEPVLNCANGMLDLRTGELLPHGPQYLSAQQIPVPWDPGATAPHYEAWLQQVIPDQGRELEEVASTMLDPSRTPAKALFAFGPSHSGKSTALRILGAVAGPENISGVSLHQLADNRFMAAALYQKMANIAADLSSAHLTDMSLFKMMSGEDVVEADRKYGLPFRFTNQALFAFSANEPPTVSETSDAYTNRISPFRFPFSFAGREDPTIEDSMMRELPGILVRWVGAWQGFHGRGGYLPQDADVRQEFETRSDRVARWAATRCDVHPDAVGRTVGADQGDTITSLYVAFRSWAEDDGTAKAMSRPKFAERLRTLPGVGEVRLTHRNKNVGMNVTTRTGEDKEIGQTTRNRDVAVTTTGGSNDHGVGSDLRSVGSGVGAGDLGVGSDLRSVTSVSAIQPYVRVGTEEKKIMDTVPTHRQDCEQPTLPTPPTPAVWDPFDGPAPVPEPRTDPLTTYTESDGERVRTAGPDRDRVPPDAGVHVDGPVPQWSAGAGGPVGGSAGAGPGALPSVQTDDVTGAPNPFAPADPAAGTDDFDWSA